MIKEIINYIRVKKEENRENRAIKKCKQVYLGDFFPKLKIVSSGCFCETDDHIKECLEKDRNMLKIEKEFEKIGFEKIWDCGGMKYWNRKDTVVYWDYECGR